MSLFGIFGGDSSSSTSTSTSDQKVAADNSGKATRVDGNGATVNIGSDAVAQAAITAGNASASQSIQNSQAVLAKSTDFIGAQLTNLFNVIDHQITTADHAASASQALAASTVDKSQTTNTDSLVKTITIIAVAGVALMAFKSGAIKL